VEKIIKKPSDIVLWELPLKIKRVKGRITAVYLKKKNKWIKLPDDDDIVIDLKSNES